MAAKKIVKSRFFPVYNKDGSTNLAKFKNQSGVYLIQKDSTGIVYVGYSGTNLYKTVLRHFQSWEDRTQVRATFSKLGYSVRIILCSPDRAVLLEAALLRKLSPIGNPMLLKGKNSPKEYAILDEYETAPATNYADLPDAPF
jgi:excinuclease UvrABC nuclease subunit